MGFGLEVRTAAAAEGGVNAGRNWKRHAFVGENVGHAPMGRGYGRADCREAPEGLRPRLTGAPARGAVGNAHLEPIWKLLKIRGGIGRGEIIADTGRSSRHFTVLLEGMACMATRHEDGARQIYAFHHRGDFLGLHGLLHPHSTEHIEVEALSTCTVGTIDRDVLEQTIQRNPAVGRTLWRAAMVEASIFRQRLLMVRWPAMQRIAHLLCEQLSRLEPGTRMIPLNQIEVADTVGLSIVHANRSFQELRKLGVLAEKRCIEVVDTKRLKELAVFDSRYLDPSEFLSRWDLRIEA